VRTNALLSCNLLDPPHQRADLDCSEDS
jgi:hypothetical protein